MLICWILWCQGNFHHPLFQIHNPLIQKDNEINQVCVLTGSDHLEPEARCLEGQHLEIKKPFVTLEWPARPIAKQRHRVSDLRTVNVSFKATFWVFVSILVDRDDGLDSVDPDVGQLTCHNPAWCCGGLFLKTCLWSFSRLSVSLYVFETNCYDMKASHHRTQSKHIKSCSFLSASIWLQHTNTVCLSCGFV